jgi:tRNA nucleotidyltransferase (CCA-adding enzyme)
VKTDALRRQDRFAALLATFELLGIDVSRLIKLRDLLNVIDVETLDKSDVKHRQ